LITKTKKEEVVHELEQMARVRVRDNRKRNEMWDEIEKMALNDWTVPADVKKRNNWLHEITSSDPQDALRAANQVLSSVMPKIQYVPSAPGAENEKRASAIEANLAWQWSLAERRHEDGLLTNVVGSALQYATIAGQIVFLPHQLKAVGALGGDTKKIKNAMRHGKFAVVLHNPKNVHATYTDYGLEDVLHIKVWKANKFLAFFGKSIPKEMQKQIKDDKYGFVLVYEYMDLDRHVVAAVPRETTGIPTTTPDTQSTGAPRMKVIFDEKNTLGFIPWVVRSRGVSFFEKPEESIRPLLFGIVTSNHWNNANIMLSIGGSEVLIRAASPRRRVKGPNPAQGYTVDWNNPGGVEMVDSAHDVEDVPPHQLDQGVFEVIDRLGSMMGKETVAKIIQNPEVSPDVPFSALNLVFQLGANSIKPFQTLAENWLADAFFIMMLFVDKFVKKEPLITYASKGNRAPGQELGEQTILKSGMFDPENLYIKVSLTAAVPTDQMAKANAISIMNEKLKYPLSRGLEELGIPDPDVAIDEWSLEKLKENDLMLAIQEQQGQQEIVLQQMAALGQQMSQLQQMQGQMEQQGQPQEGVHPGGPGFDGGLGGTPSQQAAPGQDQGGNSGQAPQGPPPK